MNELEKYKDKLAGIIKTYNEAVAIAMQNWKDDTARAGTVYTATVADAGNEAIAQVKKLQGNTFICPVDCKFNLGELGCSSGHIDDTFTYKQEGNYPLCPFYMKDLLARRSA